MFRVDVQKNIFFLAQVNFQFSVVYNLKDLSLQNGGPRKITELLKSSQHILQLFYSLASPKEHCMLCHPAWNPRKS